MSLADENNIAGALRGPADLRQRLRQSFKASGLRVEAERLKRPVDRSSLSALMEAHRLKIWEAREVYKIEYNTRVELRLRELIDHQGKKTLDHRHPQGMADRFSPHDLRRQAERDVRHDHEKHMVRLRNQRAHDIKVLIDKARREQAVQGKAKDGFTRATDRRDGRDRRAAKPSRTASRATTRKQTRKRD
jgi:hypothetical protein